MNREKLLSLLFLLPALLLLLAPADTFRQWRLHIYGFFQKNITAIAPEENVSDSSAGVTDNTNVDIAADSERVQAITMRLVQMEAETAALRMELRNLVEMRNRLPKTSFYPAKIIALEPGNPPAGVYIDAGTALGVQKGDGMALGYIFAGTVVQVDEYASLALLPSSPGSFVPARTQNGREVCAVKADGQGGATAIFYSGKTTATVGEYVLTSGLLGRMPEGLVIGKLEDFPHRGSEPGTLESPVRLELDPYRLENVAVISRENPR